MNMDVEKIIYKSLDDIILMLRESTFISVLYEN